MPNPRDQNAAYGGGNRNAEKVSSDESKLPKELQRTFPTDDAPTEPAVAEKKDAAAQFVRRKADEVRPGIDGLHSANPKVISGDGDATQPLKPGKAKKPA